MLGSITDHEQFREKSEQNTEDRGRTGFRILKLCKRKFASIKEKEV